MALGSRRKSSSSDSKTARSNNKPSTRLSDRAASKSSSPLSAKSKDKSVPRVRRGASKKSSSLQGGASAALKGVKGTKSVRPTSKYSTTPRIEAKTIAEIRSDRKTSAAAQSKRAKQADMSRRAEERAEKRRRAKIPVIIAAVFAALAICATIAYLVVANTDVFEIEEIEIQGTEHLTNEEVTALVTIPKGTTLLNVDDAQIAASLERDAWVSSVDIVKSFPHKLEIIVHERSIGAIVEVATGQAQTIQRWAISDDGIWLMVIPSRTSEVGSKLAEQIYLDAEAALHIVDVPYGIDPQIGMYCTDENVNNALEIITGMTTELADQVKLVNAAEATSILLTLDSNVEIAFGTPDNIREKERICLEIIDKKPGVVYINVRVPDRPTWRAA